MSINVTNLFKTHIFIAHFVLDQISNSNMSRNVFWSHSTCETKLREEIDLRDEINVSLKWKIGQQLKR